MRAGVIFRCDDGTRFRLRPGGLIGRLPEAAFRIADPRISEAHALVSMRGDQLKLLALRGRLSVNGKPRSEVALVPGVRVKLASYFSLTVESVELPDELAVITLESDPTEWIGAHGVVGIFPGAVNPLRAGYFPDAAAHVWSHGDESNLRLNASPGDDPEAGPEIDHRLEVGAVFEIQDVRFRFDVVARAELESRPTLESSHEASKLRLILLFDTVHIQSSEGRSVTVDGITARLICELYQIRSPIEWQSAAQLLWDDASPEPALRQRWDQLLSRLRARLREGGLRSDLVRPTYRGLVELRLLPGDRVEDRS